MHTRFQLQGACTCVCMRMCAMAHRAPRASLGGSLEPTPGLAGQSSHGRGLVVIVGHTVDVLRHQAYKVL